jgi:polyhydroxyalkanoate synthase
MTIGTALIEYPGETGVDLQHLALLAGPRAHAEIWSKIFSWLRSID